MATITKRGDFQYRAKVRRKGYPEQTKTFERKQDALDWAATIESEMRRGIFTDRSELERTTLSEALERYLDEEVSDKKSHVSLRARIMTWLQHPLSARTLASLKGADFALYRRERLKEVKPTTVRRDLMVIAAVFSSARHDWGWPVDDNLLASTFRTLSPGKWRERRPSAEEEAALLSEAAQYSTEAVPCIVLAIETGMRRGELAKLDWSQVDFSRKVIRLHAGTTKNDDSRSVPLTLKAEETLRAMHRAIGGKVFSELNHPDSLTKMFSRICKRAAIADLRFHDMRHEAASRFAPCMPATTLAKVMGWRSIQMAMRYYNPSEEELVHAIRGAETARKVAA
ncbi:MAG TPA: site-specific integrase [Burkholderiaceae bacterium]|nr:site-specific integrase [Burkholderiaceae bacterium]